ncbi:MAG: flagellar type III secretion system protein FlhB [Limibaculum sp.]
MSGDDDSAAEKTHEATPRRLEKAREEGDLPRSQDAQTFAAYVGFGAAVLLAGGWAAGQLGEALMPFLARPQDLARQFASAGAGDATLALLGRIGPPVLALVAAPAVMILALLFAQRSIVFAPSRILPKLSRLSPIENAKNKYGIRGLVEFAKSVFKLGALGVALSITVWGEADLLPQYVHIDARFTGQLLAHQFRLVMTGVLLVAGLLAFFDLIWQRFDHLKKMRMSHQELKDEGKQAEGDPHIRARRRDRARQIANNRMLLAVPEADVVIANPTHYAVALKWPRHDGSAPVCVAKGIDEIALAIRARAEQAGVPVQTDPPTARSIHGLVEVGQEIRPEQYQAVAAAIIFADELRRKVREQQG